MRKQAIQAAAFEVATQVRAVEDQIEGAIAAIAELQGRMIHARSVAGVATATGHEALEEVADSIQALVRARGGMAKAHQVLKETQALVPGLRTTGYGDLGECPETTGTADLRVVA
ncbi:hypothetical protein [Sphingomicrobium astaxanthinifaciens]|uniref:hypothetical protein n=1 Tax=Sphingomicrobium astaxanthinifaciens TaxID=1227949 RepID=UPI001FCC248E|nr:hypothetical protein [Sphingomicrobium astaxanthinifaciens]MCJ7421565.1 hypothetical protein [Sphingomicrobium astaxanthinifaciens]